MACRGPLHEASLHERRPARPAATLSERTSGRGNRYLSGWLGKASVVAFAGEPDKHGNPTWDLFVSEPQPRAEAGQDAAAGEVRHGGPKATSADAAHQRAG